MRKLIIFGGTGFIGSHLCDHLLNQASYEVYICSRTVPQEDFWLHQKYGTDRVNHVVCDVQSQKQITECLAKLKPEKVVFCAGENPSNVPKDSLRFINGNIINSLYFLNSCLAYFRQLDQSAKERFKVLNVSSYEIYEYAPPNTDPRIYPKTIYSASKAASFHLFEAWKNTYDLPVISAVCSNNYGMNQSSDKLIPLTIQNILSKQSIKLFQGGACKRNWIHVNDTSAALALILEAGRKGAVYDVASADLLSNKQLVNKVISNYVKLSGANPEQVQQLVVMVDSMNNPANSHDCQYNQLAEELNWKPTVSIDSGLLETVKFYLQREDVK